MVSPAQRRAVVHWAREEYRLSDRRACRALAVHRSPIRYRSRRGDDAPLRQRRRELAADRLTFGVKRLTTLLRREGRMVNHKRVYRVYCEEGLQLRPSGRSGAAPPGGRDRAESALGDGLHARRAERRPDVPGLHHHRCLHPRGAGHSRPRALPRHRRGRAAGPGGLRSSGWHPGIIQCDNGTEFTSVALDHWAYWNQVQLDFSRPGKPVDNCVCEAFNGTLRRECLTLHWFRSLAEAQAEIDGWRRDYNNARPHTSLGHHTPVDWWRAGSHLPRGIATRN